MQITDIPKNACDNFQYLLWITKIGKQKTNSPEKKKVPNIQHKPNTQTVIK